MKLFIIWPGKIKNTHMNFIAEEYCKKIEKMIRFQLVQIRENKRDSSRRLLDEKKLIEEKIPASSYLIVLDAKGTQSSTEDLLKRITSLMNSSYKNLVFIMGSHYGLHSDIKQHANFALALSSMDLPHELTRVILLEQIYRILAYMNNVPYAK
ncbi:MAG: hypothetical protein A2Y62_20985 [Candidatus Fischerbacteria bacterium RBG_13_37_8]|uniref:Ribosomal RNA large subunit methyltransferase H n=1 Tax=Candidatus Fischerbacteria bacterium RBG_13_37_8 TaxID=1817863 RepID=A0A1F5VVQ5_9BACT|nr:MAG: hypothetical protein A2Y62_20985 [Candidatus Fischerbacteria bacterium RBG_13_37_8]